MHNRICHLSAVRPDRQAVDECVQHRIECQDKVYNQLEDLTRIGDFTRRVSDCEELVGVTHRR